MTQGSVASVSLSTAHDVVLEGLGEDGQHPGPLAEASCVAEPTAAGWLLRLHSPAGQELGRAVWRVGSAR